MKFALVFPGQGSQSLGMMRAYGDNPIIRQTFDQASSAIGRDLWELVESGPAEALNQTVNTQPLMLTASIAVYRLWCDGGGPQPDMVAGHSLGEYSALVAAGAVDFLDAVPLVEFRAKAMQEAVPKGVGAMAVILGLDAAGVEAACAESGLGEVVEAVNYNAPEQIVIAGAAAAVERAGAACKARGAKRAMPLPVSAPFHCSLMRPAAEQLRSRLAEVNFAAPRIALVNNVDGACLADPQAIKEALVRQAAAPVRWVASMQFMAAAGVNHVYECGPGRVLAGLAKRCVGGLTGVAMDNLEGLTTALAAVKR